MQSEPYLVWEGWDGAPHMPTCSLLESPALAYGRRDEAAKGADSDNRLIYGDNLLALAALRPDFAGRIQCVYIDPPYNTRSAFEHYDDSVDHACWLTLMRDRLVLLRELLTPGGILFVSIGDEELAYLKVLLDGLFGRANYCGMLVWERKKKPAFLNAMIGAVTEYVLVYSRDRTRARPLIGGTTTPGKKYPLNNAGNGRRILAFPPCSVEFQSPDCLFEPQDMSAGQIYTRLLDHVEVRDGRNTTGFRLEGEWRYSQLRLDAILAAGERIVISKAPFRPNHIKAGGAPKKLKNILSVAHCQMSTYEDATAESRALFGHERAFDYPKPEKLIATLISACTEPGDRVLDCFAGSGTTGAVAHKLGRRWIMVESREHCHTHILPRMRKVIDGEDPGGVTAAAGWQGGGDFRFFTVVDADARASHVAQATSIHARALAETSAEAQRLGLAE